MLPENMAPESSCSHNTKPSTQTRCYSVGWSFRSNDNSCKLVEFERIFPPTQRNLVMLPTTKRFAKRLQEELGVVLREKKLIKDTSKADSGIDLGMEMI